MSNRPLRLEITVNSSDPRLLEGLDNWLQLGLISESHVRWVAKQYLTCRLPEPVAESTKLPDRLPRDFTPETIPPVRERNNLFSQVWQSFKDEISIRWWLFLGLFLVVASSGGLAATQWQRFPGALQYGILWSYTLIFWIVGFWANRQEGLRLTAQTLQTIALLLIPVNFWAMDGLGGNLLAWITVAIASITLTAIYFVYRKSSQSIFLFFNFIGLSYLHWGWEWKEYPAIAVYIGVIVTAIILRFFSRQQANASPIIINRGFVIYALSVLLIRAIFIVNLPIQQLGLAIGVCGWLMQGASFGGQGGQGRQGRQGGQGGQGRDFTDSQFPNPQSPIPQSPIPKTLEIIGAILLLIAWLVSITETVPWQAMGVSLLGLHFFTQRLRRDWLRRDLFAIFIIGWQAHFLIGRLIPTGFKRDAIDLSIQIAKSEAFPWTVYGITLFPYLLFFVWLTGWLYRQDKPKLALFGEWLTLALGMVMTGVSLYNPTWRSLNLFLSTCTLVYVVRHRTPIRVALLYFTHALGLLAVCVTIDWWFPALPSSVWASIFLGLAVIEWGVCTHAEAQRRRERIQRVWCRSCWHFGFVLASISYPLLWERVEAFFATGESPSIVLSWMLVPLTLTSVALRMGGKRRRRATIFSSYALILAQVLTIWQPSTRLVSLGVASGLMLVNSRYYRHPIAAAIQLGFSLCFVAALLWEELSVSGWFLFGAIAIFTLWLFSSWLRRQSTILASLYRQAADGWAITLCAIALILLTCKTLFSYWVFPIAHWHYLATSLVIVGAIFYRYCQQLNNYVIYGIVWTIELAICEEILLIYESSLTIAIINIILGLFSLLLTEWLLDSQSSLSQLSSLKILPLVFALLGIFWRWGEFNAYTGLLTLGAALTGVVVGYRLRRKVITYFSLIGISLACYELVIYQMVQSPGGSPADGLTILAVVAAAIALTYRLFASFLQSRNNNNFLNLNLTEIEVTAHIHWALGSVFKILAAGLATENPPQLRSLSIAISLMLAVYALIQGRDPKTRSDPSADLGNRTSSDWWVYVGLVEIFATAVYARLIWEQLSILDPFRIIIVCIFALLIYQIPWRSLGWELTPWHRFAMAIPALTTLTAIEDISYLSLLVVAAFYGRIAWRQREIRWTYVSLIFIDWAIARFLWEKSLTDILYYASIVGLSLLYIAQFDPTLSQPQQRNNRHILRLSGSGIICFIALLFHQETGLTPTIISLVAIFLGLGLQIRAFLFIGTITFILTGFYQLIVLSFERPLAKWIIGLIAGIIFIVIAANFERRREAIMRIIQNWLERLTHWE
jgi:hypothetical protein